MNLVSTRTIENSIVGLYLFALIGLVIHGIGQIIYVFVAAAPLSELWAAGPPLIFALLLYLIGAMQVMGHRPTN